MLITSFKRAAAFAAISSRLGTPSPASVRDLKRRVLIMCEIGVAKSSCSSPVVLGAALLEGSSSRAGITVGVLMSQLVVADLLNLHDIRYRHGSRMISAYLGGGVELMSSR